MTALLGTITQGERGTLSLTWQFPVDAPASIEGAAITAVMQDIQTDEVTAVTGTLTGTTATNVDWELSAGDSGTDGHFLVVFKAVVGGTDTYTLARTLVVEPNPAATAVQNPLLVSISAELATWLEAEQAGVETAVAGNLLQGDGDNSEDSGIAAATVSAHLVDTDNPHEVTAVQVDALPIDAGIVAVSEARDLLTSDSGKILECDGTFTLTAPDGLDSGFQVALINVGSGVITIAATTTLQSKDAAVTIDTQYAAATLYHRGSDVWLLLGDLA
jgi:hypothetical protein